MRKYDCWIALLLPFLLASACQAQEDVAIQLKRVPEWANALTVVRLRALLESPRGVREGWATKYQLGYLDGAVRIHPSVKTMVLATQFQVEDSAASTTVAVALLHVWRLWEFPRGISVTGPGRTLGHPSRVNVHNP